MIYAQLLDQIATDATQAYVAILKDWQQKLCSEHIPLLHAPRDVCFEHHENAHFHAHPEIFIQICGCNHFSFPNGGFDLQAGSIAVIPSGVPHGEIFEADDNNQFLCLVIMPNPDRLGILTALFNEKKIERKRGCVSHHQHFHPVDINQLNKLLLHCQELNTNNQQSAQLIMASILNIFTETMHKPLVEQDSYSSLSKQCRNIIYQLFYESDCNVQSIAKRINCTPNYLSAKFKRETGSSISQFINQVRLQHASELLTHSDLSIQQISWACGYNACSYFIARFQEVFGETPGNYRRNT